MFNKLSKKKKIVLVLGIIMAIFSMNLIQSTYAKYITITSGHTNMDIARWDIIVNKEHIKNEEELTATIEPFYVENPNVAAGVIAPGSVGYFDITINGEDTDVSFEYTISVSPTIASSVEDIVLTHYSLDEGETIKDVDDEAITGQILKTDINTTKTIRVYVKWIDGVGELMDNATDSIVGHNAEDYLAQVKVNLKFKQII